MTSGDEFGWDITAVGVLEMVRQSTDKEIARIITQLLRSLERANRRLNEIEERNLDEPARHPPAENPRPSPGVPPADPDQHDDA